MAAPGTEGGGREGNKMEGSTKHDKAALGGKDKLARPRWGLRTYVSAECQASLKHLVFSMKSCTLQESKDGHAHTVCLGFCFARDRLRTFSSDTLCSRLSRLAEGRLRPLKQQHSTRLGCATAERSGYA